MSGSRRIALIDKRFCTELERRYTAYERVYRELVSGSNGALGNSKRAIFAFHRGDMRTGNHLLGQAEKTFINFESAFLKDAALREEGAYRAAVEEFVEANFFGQFLARKPLGPIANLKNIDPESYLGGLSDLTGELVRYAVSRATAHDQDEVERASKTLTEVMTVLMNLDLTGYLRTKFDQSKNSMRRMEEIVYDLSLKAR